MTPDDYVLSLLAIVSGLALTHMIGSFSHLLASRERVRFDWLALTAAALMFYMICYSWWISWTGFHGHQHLAFWRLLMPIISAVAMFLAARGVLPEQVPAEGLDLREHYALVGRWVWRGVALGLLIANGGIAVRRLLNEGDMSNIEPWGLAGNALFLGLIVTLAVVHARRAHAVIVPVALALLVAATITRPI